MQEEIIEKIKEEQLRIQQELAKENKELIFFEQFLRKIDFSNITTYSKVSIEELIMAYVRSEANELSLEEIKEITNGIIPIFEKYTAEDIHSLLLLIDDFATAENYEEIMGVLYSEDKVDILEGLIEDSAGIEDQDYVLPAARIMEQKENEKLIEFIEDFHRNSEAWGYALLLASSFYQIKEDQKSLQERNRNQAILFPMAKAHTLEEDYDISGIKEVVKTIPKHLRRLRKQQDEMQRKGKKELKDYDQIIDVLKAPTKEITGYRLYIAGLSNSKLRLEILKEIYRRNQAYYEGLEKRYNDQVEKSEAGYETLCQKYKLSNISIEKIMNRYSYKELEGILAILTEIGIQDLTSAIEDTSLGIVKQIVDLLDKKTISIDVVKATPDIWNAKKNYPKRINANVQNIKQITGSDELYKTRSWVTLIDNSILERNLNILRQYNLLGQLHTTTNYQFLQQETLDDKIDLVLELGRENELTHNLGLLNYDSIRWQRLRILETLNIPVEEDMLDGTLHTNHFLVPDERLNEYLDIAPLPKEISLNSEEIMESSRTYIYRGIPFSKNKVRRNLTLLGKENPDYIEVLTAGRQFTQKEIDTMKQNYTK